MISYVKGILAEKAKDRIVVESGMMGIGIFVPMSVLDVLPPLGEEVKIYTHLQVREDDMSLYGFLSRSDLEMFRQLLGVNGIGPKGALGILSAVKEAVEALVALGYTNAEAVKAVKSANVTEEMDSEAVLKASLKYLAFL